MPEQPQRRMRQAQRDPAWVRWGLILAAASVVGVLIVIPVVHVFEDEVKAQADPAVYEAEIGFFAMTLDVAEVAHAMRRARREE